MACLSDADNLPVPADDRAVREAVGVRDASTNATNFQQVTIFWQMLAPGGGTTFLKKRLPPRTFPLLLFTHGLKCFPVQTQARRCVCGATPS